MEFIKLLLVWMLLFGVVWLFFLKKREVWSSFTAWVENCKERNIYIFLFLGTLLSQGWIPFLHTLPLSADETYTMSGAAFFAGYDWSPYMHMKKFYNFGYTMLLAPIYKLFNDPVTIYQMMLFANVIVHICIVLIVYRIARKQFKCTKCYSIAAALVASCNALVLFFRGFMYNEMPLVLVVWAVVLLLLGLTEASGKKRVVLSAVLGFVAAYAYIIHSRCVIVYAALAIVILLFLLVYRKWLVQPVSFCAVFGLCIYCEGFLIDYVKLYLYEKGQSVVLQNSVEHVVTGTWRYRSLTSLEGIRNLVAEFFSLAGAMTMETGGILTIVTVAVLYYFVKNFKKFRKGEEDKKTFVLLLFSLISLWGMVAAVALTGASNGKPRFIAYTRYFIPFIGPFLLMGLVILKKYQKFRYKWIVIWSGVLTVLVGVVYVFYAYPILYGKDIKLITSFYFFFAFARYETQLKFTKNIFIIALGLLVLFTMGMLFLYRRKQMTAICMAAVIFSGALYWRVEVQQCQTASEQRYTVTDATYQLLKEEEIAKERTIYCAGTDYYRRSLLITCYDEDIVYDLENIRIEKEGIILANSVSELSLYHPDYIYQMDSNEWAGIWDTTLKELFDEKYQICSQ